MGTPRMLISTALLAACLAGCGQAPAGTTPIATCVGPTCRAGPGARHVSVFVEPQAGARPILSGIVSATQSIWLEVYLLTDVRVIHALEDDAARGVDVRVLLELAPYGEAGPAPQQTLETLIAAGVHARASDPAYRYTHEKAMVVDGATVYIMTCNLTRSGLGGSSRATNREYGVIDTDAVDVAEVAAIFQADWDHRTPRLADPNLVVSPVNARARLLDLINSAHTALEIEDEEMLDPLSEDALTSAAHRGVRVDVVLPAPGGGASPTADVAQLAHGGVHVRFGTAIYTHAKLVVADRVRAFVGSENFSANSLDANRELGLIIADPTALATLETTFNVDWVLAAAYSV